MAYKIGITGGIGAGKSTVVRIFEVLSVPVYIADLEARRLMEEDAELVLAIQNLLGSPSYDEAGHLNRSWVAKKIFADSHVLARLNGLVHPVVARDYHRWHLLQQHQCAYTLEEAALLYESGSYLKMDAVIYVDAPEDVRIQRVIGRDSTSRAEVISRMRKQWPAERSLMLADFVIRNNGEALIKQVLSVHDFLTRNQTST